MVRSFWECQTAQTQILGSVARGFLCRCTLRLMGLRNFCYELGEGRLRAKLVPHVVLALHLAVVCMTDEVDKVPASAGRHGAEQSKTNRRLPIMPPAAERAARLSCACSTGRTWFRRLTRTRRVAWSRPTLWPAMFGWRSRDWSQRSPAQEFMALRGFSCTGASEIPRHNILFIRCGFVACP